MSGKIIIEYLRGKGKPNIKDVSKKDRGKPYGVIVAVEEDGYFYYGFSICNNKDKWDKTRGKKIAIGRAKRNKKDAESLKKDLLNVILLVLEKNFFEKTSLCTGQTQELKKNLTIEKIVSGEFNTHLRVGEALIAVHRVAEVVGKVKKSAKVIS